MAWFCTLPPLLLTVSGVHLFTHKKPFWQKFPLWEFLLWMVLLVLVGGLYWLGRNGSVDFARSVRDGLEPFIILLIPIWLLFGLSIVDMAVNISRWVVTSLRRLFPASTIQGLTVFMLVMRLTAFPICLIMAPMSGYQRRSTTANE